MPRYFSKTELQSQNQRIFNMVAGKYDFMNKITSLGMEPFWKRRAVKCLGTVAANAQILDLCGGTGDLTSLALKRYKQGRYIVYDLNRAMLKAGKAKIKPHLRQNVTYMLGDAMCLPFADESLDAVMVCFGLRNVPDMQGCLHEVARVLKPGGRFVCLEFAVPQPPLLRAGYRLYMASFVRLASTIITGQSATYRYLAGSIALFPPPAKVCAAIKAAGLTGPSAATTPAAQKNGTPNIRIIKLFCGVGYIYQAVKK